MKRFLLSLLTLWLVILPAQAGFFGPANFGNGFFAPPSGGSSPGGGGSSLTLDPAIDTATTAKVQLAFGFDQLVQGYSGDTVRLERTSDATEADFGFDATGRFDADAVCTWAAGSAVELVQFYDQAGTGEVHSYSTQPQFMSTSCGVTRFGTTWNSSTGQLTRSTQGAVGIVYDGATDYGETTTSGITTASGLEVHQLISPNVRQVGNAATQPAGLNPDSTQRVFWDYYVAANRYFQDRHSSGGSLDIGRFYTSGDGGTNITMTNNTSDGATNTIDSHVIKQYATFVDTLAADGTNVERYRYGAKTMSRAMDAGTITAFGNLTNGTLRTGATAGTATLFSDYLFGGIIVTDTLTDYERYMVQAKLTATAQQHLLIDVATMTGYFDEWVDFRDATTGQVIGKNGYLTLDYDTTGSPTTDYSYTTGLGVDGVRTDDGTNIDNTFAASTNYFYDAEEATVMAFFVPEDSNIQDIWSMNPAVDGNGYASGTNGLSIGHDHSNPRLIADVDDSLDTNGYADSYGYTDACTFSQGNLKYKKLIAGDWAPPVTTSGDCTLTAPYGSQFIPSGTNLTAALALTYTNILPPSPELANDWQVDYEFWAPGVPNILIATIDPHASYDFEGTQSAREPYMSSSTNYMYLSPGVGSLTTHTDTSVAHEIASGNVAHMTSDYKILSGKYQGRQFEGTNLVWAFKKGVLTQEQAAAINVSLYKIYEDGYTGVTFVPGNTVAPVASGTATVGNELSTTNGTWTGTPSSYTYQWQRCDSGPTNCVDISGATSSTYTTVDPTDVNKDIRAAVTATNARGSNTAYSNAITVASAAYDPGDETGLLVWLDPAENVTTSGSDVTEWLSKEGSLSGAGFDDTGATDVPTLAAAEQNGLDMLESIDAGDNQALAGNAALLPGLNGATGVTACAVVKPTNPSADDTIITIMGGGTNNPILNLRVTSNDLVARISNADANAFQNLDSGDGAALANEVYVVCGTFNGSSAYTYFNGVEVASDLTFPSPGNIESADATSAQIGAYKLMTSGNYQGYLGDIVLYNNAIGEAAIIRVTDYLMDKWGITIAGTPGIVGAYEVAEANVTNDDPGVTDVVSQLDDLSGNSRHMTAATTARPTYDATGGPDGTPALVFDGSSDGMSAAFPDTADVGTIMVAGDMESGDTSQCFTEWGASGVGAGLNSGLQMLMATSTLYYRGWVGGSNKAVTDALTLPTSPGVHTMVYDGVTAATLSAYFDGTEITPAATTVGALTNTLNRGYLGSCGAIAGGYLLKGNLYAAYYWSTVLNPTWRKWIERRVKRTVGLSAVPDVNVLVAGDSMAEPGLFGDLTWGERIAQMLPSTGSVENVADSGDTVDDQITLSNAASTVPTAESVDAAAILAGHNDIFTSLESAATIYAELLDWVADRITDGYDHIYIVAQPQSGGIHSGSDAVVKGLNDLLRADSSGDFVLIDLSGVGGLFDDSDDAACDVPECHPDRIHPAPPGHAGIAGAIMALFNGHIYDGSMLSNNVIDLMQFAGRRQLRKRPEVA